MYWRLQEPGLLTDAQTFRWRRAYRSEDLDRLWIRNTYLIFTGCILHLCNLCTIVWILSVRTSRTEMSGECNLTTGATAADIRHFLLNKNKEAICEQLKHFLFCFHAHFMLIYQEKCIKIIVNKRIITTLLLKELFVWLWDVKRFNHSLIMMKVMYIMSSVSKLTTLICNWTDDLTCAKYLTTVDVN